MPSILMDTSFPTSDRALRLCRELGEPLADALPARLWCWGIETERVSGRFTADAKQLAQIIRFHGDSEKLLHAFIECEVIEKVGENDEYYIKGWKRTAKYFKERNRLRNRYKTKKSRGNPAGKSEQSRGTDAGKSRPSSSSSSSSSSPVLFHNTGGDPASENLLALQSGQVDTATALELFEHWQTEHGRMHQSAKVLIPPPAALGSAKKIFVLAGSDIALAKQVITQFVESDHGYWRDRNWALWLIENGKNFEMARLAGPKKYNVGW